MFEDDYLHEELDNDGIYYLFKNNDVKPYDYKDVRINGVINKWRNKLEQQLFIIGNYIYFTLNGDKFYICLSSTSEEWRYISAVLNDLKIKGANRVTYQHGRLD